MDKDNNKEQLKFTWNKNRYIDTCMDKYTDVVNINGFYGINVLISRCTLMSSHLCLVCVYVSCAEPISVLVALHDTRVNKFVTAHKARCLSPGVARIAV